MSSNKGISVLAILFLAACGGGGGGGGGSGNDTSTAAVSTTTADAGPPQDVARGTLVSLDGSGSADSEGDPLTYTWTQTYGPDVTAGVGSLSGETPVFTAPNGVSTLQFSLEVDDGNGNRASDTLQVNVLEHLGPSFFVDGDNGSDLTGDGSRANPFASITHAVLSVPGPGSNYDIYVKTLDAGARYDETADEQFVPTGTSLYGGYDADWVEVGTRTTAFYTNLPPGEHTFRVAAAGSDGVWFTPDDRRFQAWTYETSF